VLRAAGRLSSMLLSQRRRRQRACWLMAWEEVWRPWVEAVALKVAMTVRMCARPRRWKASQPVELLW